MALRGVHGEVGLAQQLVDVRVAGLADRQADAQRHFDVLAVHRERLVERGHDPLGGLDGLVRAADRLEQHAELVAAEPGRRVGGAQARAQAARDVDEELVADGVPELVVDHLEVVEIEEEHGHALIVARLARERMLDAVVEQRAVGELRQRVMEGAVAQLLLERLALVDVARGDHDALEPLVREEVGGDRLDVAEAAVGALDAPVQRLRPS